MAIYRPGVGWIRGPRWRNPLSVPSHLAPPHPGYSEETGEAVAGVATERRLPGGTVMVDYGQRRKPARREQPEPPPQAEPTPEPQRSPSGAPRDWRADHGLMRDG